MPERTVQIVNKNGLHARPAAEIVKLAAKFKAAGLSDVRIQPFVLEPQWMPQTWDVEVSGGGKTIHVETAQLRYPRNRARRPRRPAG